MERNARLIYYSRELRKKQTKEESRLWFQFLRLYPLKFRRQYIIGNYIADFYCHKAKLVVELDGSQHYEQENMEYDQRRQDYFDSIGIKVIRFTNLEISRQFPKVCEEIDRVAKGRL